MKRKLSLKKISRFIAVIVLIIVLVFFIIKALKPKNNDVKPVSVIDNIEKYGYSLDDNETEYYKKTFSELKELLNKEEVDEEEYAKLISKLFIADFYNLDNKNSKNDIGGVEYIYKDFQTDFQKLASESIYHYLENNANGKRKQELPIVENVEIGSIEKSSFKYNETTDSKAYKVKVNISYKKDLDYPKEATLVLIHSNDKLEIAKMD